MPRQSLLQRHRNSLALLTLCKRDVGDGAAILQRWCDADGAGGGVASQGLLHRRQKRSLRLRHRRDMALRPGGIFAFGDRFGLVDSTACVVTNHLEELAALLGIASKL